MLRETAYHYLADLIYKGALYLKAELGGKSFIFKTLNEKEFTLIKLCSGISTKPDFSIKYNVDFLIRSVLVVEGEFIQDSQVLKDFFLKIPEKLYNKIIDELKKLRDLTTEVGPFMEGFCYTNHSRSMWRVFPTGFNVGALNLHQEYWININKMLDEEESYNQRFSMAVMVASASNPKGAKQIRSQHEASSQAIKEKRKKLARAGTASRSSWSEKGWAAPVDTAEDLVAELNRQIAGVKDRHDNFIDDYLNKLQEGAEKQVQEIQKQLDESRKRHEGEPDITGSGRVMTPKEVEEMMEASKKRANNLVMVEPESATTPEDREKFLRKIGNKVLTSKG